MKKFNQTISVEVSVDNIADQLLETWKGSNFAHSELLTETIIGSSLEQGTISMIYNTLNGYSNKIDFEVGDVVISPEKIYNYRETESGSFEQHYVPIGACVIVDIVTYRKKDKVEIKYNSLNSEGKVIENTKYVSHLLLTRPVESAIEQVEA